MILLNEHPDLKIIRSASFDPWYNLALEEYLLKQIEEKQVILYLWQNRKTVVIGRNQNPWKECRGSQLEKDGGKLARRLSGGGAVFHDLGNLNFTFLVDRKLYNLEKQLSVILQAVKMQGIEAKFSGRNDLVVNEKKFSGNAFYFTGKAAYHHGTILIDVDISDLLRYLQVSTEKIASKGIASVRARVVNLKELQHNMTIENMVHCLKQSFKDIYAEKGQDVLEEAYGEDNDNEDMAALYNKYASWEWRYGDSPSFDVVFEHRFAWGGVETGLKYKNGIIQEAMIYSDAMNEALIRKISFALRGISFKSEAVAAAIRNHTAGEADQNIVQDIEAWLCNKIDNL